MSKLHELISDDLIDHVWDNANFGATSKREVIRETLLKCAAGYRTGKTAKEIVIALGLIYADTWQLTKLGKEYLYEAYESPQPVAALQAQLAESRHDTAIFKEWHERAEKNITAMQTEMALYRDFIEWNESSTQKDEWTLTELSNRLQAILKQYPSIPNRYALWKRKNA